jgi:predicted homoserine dehydrogenase-like protein
VGLELNMSIANAVLRGIPTGAPIGFHADVVATAKKDLAAGDVLDGEGGFAVYGKLVPAQTSVDEGYLPVALAHHVPLKNAVAQGESVRWSDVEIDESLAQALELRRETEALVAS